jgi:steroid 5-alpha reductase family enzyme
MSRLYLVLGLQAALSWIISLPLLGAAVNILPLGPLETLGAASRVWP